MFGSTQASASRSSTSTGAVGICTSPSNVPMVSPKCARIVPTISEPTATFTTVRNKL